MCGWPAPTASCSTTTGKWLACQAETACWSATIAATDISIGETANEYVAARAEGEYQADVQDSFNLQWSGI